MNHAAMNIAQTAIISAQNTRLQALEHSVQAGHATILTRLDDAVDRPRISSPVASHHTDSEVRKAKQSHTMVHRRKKPFARKFRVSLPGWLVSCAWEFGIRESESGWDLQINPVNLRPSTSFAYDVVQHGNVLAFRKLLDSKELSIRDHFPLRESWASRPASNIFEVRH